MGRKSRIYWRNGRAWGDFRDFADAGGDREPLKPKGSTMATKDADVAADLASKRVKELEKKRRGKGLTGLDAPTGLAAYAADHLDQKAEEGAVTDSWLKTEEHQLKVAVEFFGAERHLDTISVDDMQEFTAHLRRMPNGRGGTLADSSVRKYLNSVSNLYRRASGAGHVLPGYNPVAGMMNKPSGVTQHEAEWFEPYEAALILEAIRHYRPMRTDMDPIPHGMLLGIVATYLLTGGRKSEVLGMEPEDVSFDRSQVTFRKHAHRRLKTAGAHRSVPLWPQLRELLQGYVFGGGAPHGGHLLFPSPRTGKRIWDIRKPLDAVAEMCGWSEGEIRTKMFRHTYCAARLQTADRVLKPGRKPDDDDAYEWIPVSTFQVGKELGHGGQSLVQRVYGHLGSVRQRREVVEYRIEEYQDKLAAQLRSIRVWNDRPTRCRFEKPNGQRCGARGNLSGDGLCLWHDPERQEEARAARPHADYNQEDEAAREDAPSEAVRTDSGEVRG